jgi:hypothetical protein
LIFNDSVLTKHKEEYLMILYNFQTSISRECSIPKGALVGFLQEMVGSWLILMEPGRIVIIIIVVAVVASLEVIMRSGWEVLLRD